MQYNAVIGVIFVRINELSKQKNDSVKIRKEYRDIIGNEGGIRL